MEQTLHGNLPLPVAVPALVVKLGHLTHVSQQSHLYSSWKKSDRDVAIVNLDTRQAANSWSVATLIVVTTLLATILSGSCPSAYFWAFYMQ